MQIRSKRVINATLLLPLICLFMLLGGNACGRQTSLANRAPASLTAELPRAPLSSQGFTAVPTSPIEFKIVPHSQDSRVTAELAGEEAIIQIFSDGGIGSADVAVISGKLPKKITMQFHLRGLERLRFAYNQSIVEVSLSNGEGSNPFEAVVREGNATVSEPITPDSPYWIKVRLVPSNASPATIPLQEGYIEVEVPPSFWAEQNRQFSIQWIDFYR
jgi:hypothetical protein